MLRKLLFSSLLTLSVSGFAGNVLVIPEEPLGILSETESEPISFPIFKKEHIMPSFDDRWVPWPWALAQPIPWTDIQGLWKVESGDFTSYFAFKTVTLKDTNTHQIQVKQFDGATCRVLATGVGIERNSKILAQMTSRSGMVYRLQVTAFTEKDSPERPPLRGGILVESVMVVSMGALDSAEPKDMIHMETMKISRLLSQKTCFEDKR